MGSPRARPFFLAAGFGLVVLLFGRGQSPPPPAWYRPAPGRSSPLVDVSVWRLPETDLVTRFMMRRQAITGPPAESKRRWSRMMRAGGAPVPPPRGPDTGWIPGDLVPPPPRRGAPPAWGPPPVLRRDAPPARVPPPPRRRSRRGPPVRPPAPRVWRGQGPPPPWRDPAGRPPWLRLPDAPTGAFVPALLSESLRVTAGRLPDRLAGEVFLGPLRGTQADPTPELLDPETPEFVLGEAGYPAGPEVGGRVYMDARSRWNASRAVLQGFGSAYVTQDIQAVMHHLSANAHLDPTVLRNALMEDFEQDAEIYLDIEIREYRMTFDTVTARISWLRSSVLEDGTPTAPTSGQAELLFDRHDGHKIKVWKGPAPFGVRDAELRRQVAGGDPNAFDEPGGTPPSPTAPPPTTPPPGPPTPELVSTVSINQFGEVICVDFDGPTVTMTNAVFDSTCVTSPGPPADLVFSIPMGFSGYSITQAGSPGPPSITDCGPIPPTLEQFRDLPVLGLTSVTSSASPANYGAFTGANHVIFELTFTPGVSPDTGDFSMRVFRDPSMTVNPGGTLGCSG